MHHLARPIALVFVLVATCCAQVQAKHNKQSASQDPAASQSRDQALPASVRRVERETGGEVISAETVQRDGREVYHVKVLTPNGRVKMVQTDPQDPRQATRNDAGNRPTPKHQDQGQGQNNRDSRNEPEPESSNSDEDDNPNFQP